MVPGALGGSTPGRDLDFGLEPPELEGNLYLPPRLRPPVVAAPGESPRRSEELKPGNCVSTFSCLQRRHPSPLKDFQSAPGNSPWETPLWGPRTG